MFSIIQHVMLMGFFGAEQAKWGIRMWECRNDRQKTKGGVNTRLLKSIPA